MSPVGVLFDRTFQAFRSRWRALLAIMAIEVIGRYALIIAGAAAMAIAVLGGLSLAGLAGLQEKLQDVDVLLSMLVPLLVILLAGLTVLAVFETWIMTALFYAAEHPAASLRSSLAAGWTHFVPFGWVLTLTSLLVTVGLFFFIIPGLVLSFLFLLAPNAYFAEQHRGWAALTRARDCVTGRFGETALRLGLCWLAVAGGAALCMGTGIPLFVDAFGLVAAPWLVLYHSALFRELAEIPA